MGNKQTDTYRTIATPTQSLYKEKGSKFIGLAYPVTSEEEIKSLLAQLKKEYYDARHHCYAYKLGTGESLYRANDDGEPNHSAGDPILGQIRSFGLTNILVVVVRYFGGTKLGVSGLIQAYKTAASEALSSAEIIEMIEITRLSIQFGYEQMNGVMSLLKECKLDILEQDFKSTCQLTCVVRKSELDMVKNKLGNMAGVAIINYLAT